MGRRAESLVLSGDERLELERLVRVHSTSQQRGASADDFTFKFRAWCFGSFTGAPARITPQQVCAIIALACEHPSKIDLPLSHWSASDLAREAVKRGLVDRISPRQAGRFLKRI